MPSDIRTLGKHQEIVVPYRLSRSFESTVQLCKLLAVAATTQPQSKHRHAGSSGFFGSVERTLNVQ